MAKDGCRNYYSSIRCHWQYIIMYLCAASKHKTPFWSECVLLWTIFHSVLFPNIRSFTQNYLNLHKFSINAVFSLANKSACILKLASSSNIVAIATNDKRWFTVIDWYKWLLVRLLFVSVFFLCVSSTISHAFGVS